MFFFWNFLKKIIFSPYFSFFLDFIWEIFEIENFENFPSFFDRKLRFFCSKNFSIEDFEIFSSNCFFDFFLSCLCLPKMPNIKFYHQRTIIWQFFHSLKKDVTSWHDIPWYWSTFQQTHLYSKLTCRGVKLLDTLYNVAALWVDKLSVLTLFVSIDVYLLGLYMSLETGTTCRPSWLMIYSR